MNRRPAAAVAITVTLRSFAPIASALIAALAPAIAVAGDDHECMASVSAKRGHAPIAQAEGLAGGTTLVLLDRNGGRLTAGDEDAAARRSEVLWMRGLAAVNVPKWSRSDAEWDGLVDCVRDRFADYDVQITDERPESTTFVRAMVGGRPSLLGLGSSVGGIAPYNGRVIDQAVVFVFEQSIGSSRSRCEATAHEIGHALGLDHSTACDDVMSYGQCGPKEFLDETAACGEYSGRTCSNGRSTQNSHAMLASNVGVRSVRPVPTPPAVSEPPAVARRRPMTRGRQPHIARRLPDANRNRQAAPRVTIHRAPQSQRGDSEYTLQVRARDPDGIARVELFWTDGARAYRLQCGRSHGALPVRCSRRGDMYTFALGVGRGQRAFAVRVTDGAGLAAVTKPRYVRLK